MIAISADQNNFCDFIFKHENLKREDTILDSSILFSNITLDNQLNYFYSYIMSWRFLSRDGWWGRTPNQKSLITFAILLALSGAIYSWIVSFLGVNRIFSISLWENFIKTHQPVTFQGLFRVTNQIREIWNTTIKTFYKPAQHWINKIFVKTEKTCIWAAEFCDFKVDVIKW